MTRYSPSNHSEFLNAVYSRRCIPRSSPGKRRGAIRERSGWQRSKGGWLRGPAEAGPWHQIFGGAPAGGQIWAQALPFSRPPLPTHCRIGAIQNRRAPSFVGGPEDAVSPGSFRVRLRLPSTFLSLTRTRICHHKVGARYRFHRGNKVTIR